MENQYTVNELISIFGISKETFYNVRSSNLQFFNENRVKVKKEGTKSKPIFKYNQSVFAFLSKQYGQEGPASSDAGAELLTIPKLEDVAFTVSPEAHAETQTGPQGPTQEAEGEILDKPAQAKIEALQAEIEALKTQLEKVEGEKAEAQKQLGIALLCLQQEKAEKQLLLPGPKKSIGARIKGLFGKKQE